MDRVRGTILVILVAACCPHAAVSQVGGLTFLNLPPGAAGLAAGSAYTADARGPFAVHWNAAGLTGKGHSAAVSYQAWLEDVQLLAASSRFDIGGQTALGVFVTAVSSGDLEARQRPGEPDGTFSAQFLTGGAAIARAFGNVRVGMAAKLLSERIFSYTATGAAIDLGLQSEMLSDRLRVGFAVQHLGSMEKLATESTELPRTVRGGASVKVFSMTMEDDDERLLSARVSVEASKRSTEDEARLHVGSTTHVFDFLTVRLGLMTGDEILRYSAGIGLQVNALVFDFAYLPFRDGFGGSSEVLSIRYDW
jgi:hypothetical protein